MTTSWWEFEAITIASRNWIKIEVLSNMQKREILKSVIHFLWAAAEIWEDHKEDFIFCEKVKQIPEWVFDISPESGIPQKAHEGDMQIGKNMH